MTDEQPSTGEQQETGFFAWRRRRFAKSAAAFQANPWRYAVTRGVVAGPLFFLADGLGAAAAGTPHWQSALVRGCIVIAPVVLFMRYFAGPYSVSQTREHST